MSRCDPWSKCVTKPACIFGSRRSSASHIRRSRVRRKHWSGLPRRHSRLASDLNLAIGCTLRLPLVSLIYLPCACGLTLVGRRFISPEPPQTYNAAGRNSSLKRATSLSLSHRSRPNSDSLRAPDHRSESPSMTTAPVEFRRANPVDKEMIQRISADSYIPAYMAVLGTIPKPATERLRAAH